MAQSTAGRNSLNSIWNGWVVFWRTTLPGLWANLNNIQSAINYVNPS